MTAALATTIEERNEYYRLRAIVFPNIADGALFELDRYDYDSLVVILRDRGIVVGGMRVLISKSENYLLPLETQKWRIRDLGVAQDLSVIAQFSRLVIYPRQGPKALASIFQTAYAEMRRLKVSHIFAVAQALQSRRYRQFGFIKTKIHVPYHSAEDRGVLHLLYSEYPDRQLVDRIR